MDLRQTGWEDVVWIELAQDREHFAGYCKHGNELSCYIKDGEIL